MFKYTHPAVHIFMGSPRSGKSFCIKWLIHNFALERKYTHGLCFTNTAHDRDFSFMPDTHVSMYNENRLKKLLNFQKDRMEKGTATNCFIIIDDALGSINWRSNLMTALFSQYRHFKCSIFLGVQYPWSIPPIVRTCATYAYLFPQINKRAITACYQSYGMLFDSEREFHRFLDKECVDFNIILVVCQSKGTKEARYKKIKAKKCDYKLSF